jgi:hypothetical protein
VYLRSVQGLLRVAVVSMTACYQPNAQPLDSQPIEDCEITCDFAGQGNQAPCPEEMSCVGTPFAQGACVSVDVTTCGTIVTPVVAGQPFNTPPAVLLSTTGEDDDPTLTEDQLELYLFGTNDLRVSKRDLVTEQFGAPVVVTELDSPLTQFRPCLSPDGLTLVFTQRQVGPPVHDDIYVTTRALRTDLWGTPVPLAADFNTTDNELPAWLSPDKLTLVFEANPGGGTHDLFIVRRAATTTEFVRSEARPIVAVNTTANDGRGGFDATGTIFLFESNRTGSAQTAIWEAFLDATGSWTVVAHPELDSARVDGTPWLSSDGRTVVFSSNRVDPGSNDDLFIATR